MTDRSLLLDIAANHPRVLKDRENAVLVKALGDNGIEIELNVWINDADQGQGSLRSDLLTEIWHTFQKNGISVPFPQRQIRVTTESQHL